MRTSDKLAAELRKVAEQASPENMVALPGSAAFLIGIIGCIVQHVSISIH